MFIINFLRLVLPEGEIGFSDIVFVYHAFRACLAVILKRLLVLQTLMLAVLIWTPGTRHKIDNIFLRIIRVHIGQGPELLIESYNLNTASIVISISIGIVVVIRCISILVISTATMHACTHFANSWQLRNRKRWLADIPIRLVSAMCNQAKSSYLLSWIPCVG